MDKLRKKYTLEVAILINAVISMGFLLFGDLSLTDGLGLKLNTLMLINDVLALLNNWSRTDWSNKTDKTIMVIWLIGTLIWLFGFIKYVLL